MNSPENKEIFAPSQAQASPPPVFLDVTSAKLGLYEAMDRHILSLRHLQVLRVIRARSFDLGQTWAWVPSLSYFGMDKADASVAIDELVAWHIIEAPERPAGRRGDGRRFPRPEGGHYAINVFWKAWGAPERHSSAWDEQLWLAVKEPTLEEGLRRSYFEFDQVPHPNRSVQLPSVTGVSPDARTGDGLCRGPAAVRLLAGAGVGEVKSPQPSCPSGSVGESPTLDPSQEGALRDPPTLAPNDDAPLTVGGLAWDPENPAPAPAALVSPHTPLPLTETEGLTVKGKQDPDGFLTTTVRARARGTVGKIPTAPLLTWEEQRRLEDELLPYVGDDLRPERSRAFWITRVIRNFPDALQEALREMRYLDLTRSGHFQGQQHRTRWLVTATANNAGVKSWKHVRPGPEPIR